MSDNTYSRFASYDTNRFRKKRSLLRRFGRWVADQFWDFIDGESITD